MYFVCRCNLITDMGIGYLSTMSSLRKLFLRYCQQVHDLGLHHIYSMRKLTHLSLAGKAGLVLGRIPHVVVTAYILSHVFPVKFRCVCFLDLFYAALSSERYWRPGTGV